MTHSIFIKVLRVLTHRGRVTHICVSKLTIIGPDNGLSPGRRQAIIWTNAGILLIVPLGTNFNEILIEIYIFPSMKMHLKLSSGIWRPFCLNVLKVLFKCVDKGGHHISNLLFQYGTWSHSNTLCAYLIAANKWNSTSHRTYEFIVVIDISLLNNSDVIVKFSTGCVASSKAKSMCWKRYNFGERFNAFKPINVARWIVAYWILLAICFGYHQILRDGVLRCRSATCLLFVLVYNKKTKTRQNSITAITRWLRRKVV